MKGYDQLANLTGNRVLAQTGKHGSMENDQSKMQKVHNSMN
jgi:hypothetical protein